MIRSFFLAIGIVYLLFSAATAEIPQTIAYQGRVTSSSGSPITDPAASFQFRLYPVAAGGTAVWTEVTTLPVEEGLFSHALGSSCPSCGIPVNAFVDNDSLWLEVAFEGQVINPRTRMTANPYSYRVATIDKATGGTITGSLVLNGDQGFQSGGQTVMQALATSNILRNFGSDGNGENWRLWGNSFGQLQLFDNLPSNGLQIEMSAFAAGGVVEILRASNPIDIIFDGTVSGDASVILGASAVQSSEILDEAGAANNKTGSVALGIGPLTILSRSISCPNSGYVLVFGGGWFELIHANGTNSQADIWVSETVGPSTNKPHVRYSTPPGAASGTYHSPYSVQGLFSVPAGTSTFYLMGEQQLGGSFIVGDNQLTLLFVPSAYGFVASNSPPPEPNDPATLSYNTAREPQETTRLAEELLVRDVSRLKRQVDELSARLTALKAVNETTLVED